MNRKKIFLAIIILAVIAGFVGYKMYNKPHVDVAESSSDIVITADNLVQAFSTDETAANEKYLDKIVEVKGEISSMKLENEKGIVYLKTSDDFASVLCNLSESSTQKMNDLKEGQTIIVKGICTGFLMDVVLVKSEIIE